VFVPGAAAIGMGMVLTAPIGGKLARFLPKVWLRKLFAVVLFAAAAGIFLSQLPIRGFLAGRQDSLQELLLGPLCDPPPAPAAPAFDTNASRSER
jgi:fructose-specific phosphotransferase system IIC component